MKSCINGDRKQDGGSPRKAEMSRRKGSQKNKGHGEGRYFVSPSVSHFPGRLTSCLAQSGSRWSADTEDLDLSSLSTASSAPLRVHTLRPPHSPSALQGSGSTSRAWVLVSCLGRLLHFLSFMFYCCCSQGLISSKCCFKQSAGWRCSCLRTLWSVVGEPHAGDDFWMAGHLGNVLIHILGHKTSLKKNKRISIVYSMFPDHHWN